MATVSPGTEALSRHVSLACVASRVIYAPVSVNVRPSRPFGATTFLAVDEASVASWSSLGEGESLWFLGTLATIRVPGEASGGRFALIEFLFPRHASPPLHTHPQDESYIVLEGRLTVQAGGQRFELDSGAAATVPIGVAHTFRADTDNAHVLVLSTPAGLERLVRDAAVPAAKPTLPPSETPRPSTEELTEIFRRHGQVNLGPPLGPDD